MLLHFIVIPSFISVQDFRLISELLRPIARKARVYVVRSSQTLRSFFPTWGSLAPIQINLTKCLLSDSADNPVYSSYLLKDLRDSYACRLLTAGVQLGWISVQLGHSDVATTARHYARLTGGDLYREPLHLRLGDVPSDSLARIDQ
jgi:hypothetical protein